MILGFMRMVPVLVLLINLSKTPDVRSWRALATEHNNDSGSSFGLAA
jgi:hypothetical protein